MPRPDLLRSSDLWVEVRSGESGAARSSVLVELHGPGIKLPRRDVPKLAELDLHAKTAPEPFPEEGKSHEDLTFDLPLLDSAHLARVPDARVPGHKVGRFLERWLIEGVRRKDPETAKTLARYLRDATWRHSRRIVLHVDRPEPSLLLWEALPLVATNKAALVRWTGRDGPESAEPIHRRDCLRVLIIVCSLVQDRATRGADTAGAEALRNITAGLARVPGLELQVLVPQGLLDATDRSFQSDRTVLSVQDILEVIKEGWEVVHFFGHSWGKKTEALPGGAGAQALEIDFSQAGGNHDPRSQAEASAGEQGSNDAGTVGDVVERPEGRAGEAALSAEPNLLWVGDLRDALWDTQNRLVVLQACDIRSGFAEVLAETTDHVIGMNSWIGFELFLEWCARFYGEIAGGGSVTSAVQASRAAAPWQTAHWSRTLRARPFLDRTQLELWEYQQEVLELHRTLLGSAFGNVKAEDALDKVYVDLSFESEAEGEGREAGRRGQAGEPRATTVDQRKPRSLVDLAVDRFRGLNLTDHKVRLVLVAEAGSGKTTVLRKVARKLAECDDRFPFYTHVTAFRGERTLEQVLGHRFELFRSLDQRRRCVVLLDGLDEAGEAGVVDRARREMARVRSPVIIATRRVGFRHSDLPGYRRLRLLDLDHQAMPGVRLTMLEKWVRDAASSGANPKEEARKTRAKLKGSLHTLTRTPLFVHLVALLDEKNKLDEGQLPDDPGAAVPVADTPSPRRWQRFEIFGLVLDCLLGGEHHEPATPMVEDGELEPVLAVLCKLATELTRRGRTRIRLAGLVGILKDWKREDSSDEQQRLYQYLTDVGPARLWGFRPSRFVAELSRRTNLLAPVNSDEVDGDWKFWVKSFQDHFTAEWLHVHLAEPAGADTRGAIDGVLAFIDESPAGRATPLWGETLALLIERQPTEHRREWIERLVEWDATAGRRVLAFVDPENITQEILEKALAVEGNDDERRQALRDLAASIAAGDTDDNAAGKEAVTKLLSSYAKGTTRHADRWFVAEILAERGFEIDSPERRAPFEKPGVDLRELLARFSWAKPGHALWREIPSGYFVMGSPVTEKGRRDDEVLRTIHMDQDFWAAAIPVTEDQLQLFAPARPRKGAAGLPATIVTWYEAFCFTRWLTLQISRLATAWGDAGTRNELWPKGAEWLPGIPEPVGGLVARLPTEVEWEYMARGRRWDSATQAEPGPPFWCDAELSEDVAVFGGRPLEPTPGAREKNGFGLFDVHGQVWEWCLDAHAPIEASSDVVEAQETVRMPSGAAARVLRGGSCDGVPGGCRAAFRLVDRPGLGFDFDFGDFVFNDGRGGSLPGDVYVNYGFRVVLVRARPGGG